MPDRDVETIRDLILYQYAKIVARSAFAAADGKEAKEQHYGFIKNTFRELKSGVKSWSEITAGGLAIRRSGEAVRLLRQRGDLHREHIVPKSLAIRPECKTCDVIQGIHNQIWACGGSNCLKGTKGLYEFYRAKYPGERKFYDLIPPLLEKKYLKTIINCHQCAETLDASDLDQDGELTVLDVDSILQRL